MRENVSIKHKGTGVTIKDCNRGDLCGFLCDFSEGKNYSYQKCMECVINDFEDFKCSGFELGGD